AEVAARGRRARGSLQPLPVRAGARHDEGKTPVGGRLDREVDPLPRIEPSDGEGEASLRTRTVAPGERRRVVERLARDAVETPQPLGGVLRIREDLAGFTEPGRIRGADQLAPTGIGGPRREVALGRAEAVVRLPELMDE